MAFSGTEKEMRMPSSWSSETIDDHNHHLQPHPDRFPTTGASAGATIMPISFGSKLKIPPPPTRYRECLKNHAASIGGNITDGCGEFMPSGDDGTLEALKCAACNCHRNFHRKESSDYSRSTVHPFPLPPPLPSPSTNKHGAISLGMHSNNWTSIIPPVNMAFGGGCAATDSSSEELNFNAAGAVAVTAPFGLSKKRFRTKFTQEQKEKMMGFAEKVGWRIPREDDAEVQTLCAEVGVKRQILKVWMHNNKNSAVKNKQGQESHGD